MIKVCDCCGDGFKRDDRTLVSIKFPKCDERVFMEEDLVLCPTCRDILIQVLHNMGFYELINANEKQKE